MKTTDSVSLSEIHPALYIGNVRAAHDTGEWTHILCTAGCETYADVENKTACPFHDTTNVKIQPVWEAEFHIRNGALILDAILKKKNISKNAKVLVHCHAGMNRSGSVIVAFAIGMGWKADDAIAYVRKQNSMRLHVAPEQAAITNPVFEFILQHLSWSGLWKRSTE